MGGAKGASCGGEGEAAEQSEASQFNLFYSILFHSIPAAIQLASLV
jgi:hypothetical protein